MRSGQWFWNCRTFFLASFLLLPSHRMNGTFPFDRIFIVNLQSILFVFHPIQCFIHIFLSFQLFTTTLFVLYKCSQNERTRIGEKEKKIFIQDNLQNDTNNAKWKELQFSITWIFMFNIQCYVARFLSDCRYYLRHSYHTFLILVLLLLFCDCKYTKFQRFMFFLSLQKCFLVSFFFLANIHKKHA